MHQSGRLNKILFHAMILYHHVSKYSEIHNIVVRKFNPVDYIVNTNVVKLFLDSQMS